VCTTSHGAADYSPSAVAIVDAAARTADGRGLTPEVEELRQALRSGSPVTIAIPVWPEFDTADGINIGSLPSNIDQLPIEHAVVVAGHDPAHNAVLIRNSWGQAWGSSGYSWFDEQILDVSEPVGAWTLDRLTPHESAPEMDEADVPLFRGAAG